MRYYIKKVNRIHVLGVFYALCVLYALICGNVYVSAPILLCAAIIAAFCFAVVDGNPSKGEKETLGDIGKMMAD
ncbi:MAG: hypothetical protein J6Y37_11435 [Paludibacteraceae bacterium]|nr:hypothetical protein [Paludibacteraceae bacterium]